MTSNVPLFSANHHSYGMYCFSPSGSSSLITEVKIQPALTLLASLRIFSSSSCRVRISPRSDQVKQRHQPVGRDAQEWCMIKSDVVVCNWDRGVCRGQRQLPGLDARAEDVIPCRAPDEPSHHATPYNRTGRPKIHLRVGIIHKMRPRPACSAPPRRRLGGRE